MTTRAGDSARPTRQTTRRHVLAGEVIVVAAAATVVPPWEGALSTRHVVGIILATATAAALGLRSPPTIRALVFCDAAFLVVAAGSLAPPSWAATVTTVLVCLVPLGCLLACNHLALLRPVTPWLRRGHADRPMLALAAVTVLGAGLALTLWAKAFQPRPAPYLRALHEQPIWLALLGILGFALVNPVWEELLFRGVILEELRSTWGTPAAVVAQAVLFGAAHWYGFPSGWAGTTSAAGWGLSLGIIRLRCSGMLLVYLVHVCTDAVIGVLALVLLR